MDIVGTLKALADENRFRLIELLTESDLCVGALARQLSITESAVSQHLKKLRECGLVVGEKRGYWTHYAINFELLAEIAARISEIPSQRPLARGTCELRGTGEVCCCPAKQARVGKLPVLPMSRSCPESATTEQS